jgi:hypothetical protein
MLNINLILSALKDSDVLDGGGGKHEIDRPQSFIMANSAQGHNLGYRDAVVVLKTFVLHQFH